MSALPDMTKEFRKAVEDYMGTATSRLVSVDSGRVYSYMRAHPEDFPTTFAYLDSRDWGKMAVKQAIGRYLKQEHINHAIFPVESMGPQRDMLYVTKEVKVPRR